MAKSKTSWSKGQSGNPGGKPKGGLSASQQRQELLDHWDEAKDKLLDRIREGDTTALRIYFERVLPGLRPQEVPQELPALALDGTLSEQARSVLSQVKSGELATGDASTLLQAIGAQVRIEEHEELQRRVEALEQQTGGSGE